LYPIGDIRTLLSWLLHFSDNVGSIAYQNHSLSPGLVVVFVLACLTCNYFYDIALYINDTKDTC